jgi:hypothetical protein
MINDIQVEVMADLETFNNAEWIKLERPRIKLIKRFEDMTLPLLELTEEYEAYIRIGRTEKAQKIKEAIDRERSLRVRTRAS